MSGRSISFSCNLVHPSKQGKLIADDNGYYHCTLGAFNVYNSAGEYYPALDSVKQMFEAGSPLRRRLDSGNCRGERDHPDPSKFTTMVDFIRRILAIDMDRVSHHIASVTLKEAKDESNNDVVLCVGKVKPSGPMGNTLRDSLNNPEENVCFSIRSLVDIKRTGDRTEKHIKNIITWDYVNEPGISVANKFQTPTLESIHDDVLITEAMLMDLAKQEGRLGLESSRTATMVLTELGWEKVELISPSTRYLNW